MFQEHVKATLKREGGAAVLVKSERVAPSSVQHLIQQAHAFCTLLTKDSYKHLYFTNISQFNSNTYDPRRLKPLKALGSWKNTIKNKKEGQQSTLITDKSKFSCSSVISTCKNITNMPNIKIQNKNSIYPMGNKSRKYIILSYTM